MKKLIALALLLAGAGCTSYAMVGSVDKGMSLSEVQRTAGSLEQTSVEDRQYRAWLKDEDNKVVEPYILTFDDNERLVDISKDTEKLLEGKSDVWSQPGRRVTPLKRKPDFRYQW